MPAAAVASFTPKISGIWGTLLGASGEMAIRFSSLPDLIRHPSNKMDARVKPAHDEMANLLLGWRHLGIDRLGVGLVRHLRSLIHALDLGRFAQLGDVFGLRLA